jgi:hypothetical protein
MKQGSKDETQEFTASIDLSDQSIIIKLDDSHKNGSNLQGRKMEQEFKLRDILSA